MFKPNTQLYGLGAFKPQPYHEFETLLPEPDYEATLSPELLQYHNTYIRLPPKEIEAAANTVQGTPGWAQYRKRITMSNASKITQHHPYTADYTKRWDELAYEMVFGEVIQNEDMKKGNEREAPARENLLRLLRALLRNTIQQARARGQTTFVFGAHEFPVPALVPGKDEGEYLEIRESGIHISKKFPWIAASSDGDVYVFGILVMVVEIKNPKRGVYGLFPVYYFDQLMGNLAVRELKSIWFYVQAPDGHTHTLDLMCYDAAYCEGFMIPMMNRFYFKHLLPQLYKRHVLTQQQPPQAQAVITIASTLTAVAETTTPLNKKKRKAQHPSSPKTSRAKKTTKNRLDLQKRSPGQTT